MCIGNNNDRCVANKMIEVTQCTIAWYVDDNKFRHKKPAVISNIINKVKKCFGYLSVVIGNKHTFLDMKIEIKTI